MDQLAGIALTLSISGLLGCSSIGSSRVQLDSGEVGRLAERIGKAWSTGERTIEYFSGAREVQGLAWALVELTSDRVELPLREAIDGLAFGEVLAQQTVRVLVRASLPRTFRVAKIIYPEGIYILANT